MAEGYFNDGIVDMELGAHVFGTPTVYRRNLRLTPHDESAAIFDSGGGLIELQVTGQRLRANLGDAERYIYEHLRTLARRGPGLLGFEDNRAQRATFGQSVCVGAIGEVRGFRFADVQMEFLSPEKSVEPWPSAVPGAPATYAGTSTAQDYAAGGVTLGAHPSSMRIEMRRDYPLRQIPRARGARSRGPMRGAELRFIVSAAAVVPPLNLARYLADLVRQIGPRAVDLTGNGNTFEGVLLESVRPVHTDGRHTLFEAEFVMPIEPLDVIASSTSTAGATTTSGAPFTGSTTTAGPTTTTEQVVDCNDCDPPLRETYCVTLSGLAGDFAAANGSWVVTWNPTEAARGRWESSAIWGGSPVEGCDVRLRWTGSAWRVDLFVGPFCTKSWQNGSDACDPVAAYAELACTDAGCADPDSCEDSAGATCVVSETWPCQSTTAGPTTTTAAFTGSTTSTEAPTTTSHACDCADLPDCMQVTVSGCGGDLAHCNGTWLLDRVGESCAWMKTIHLGGGNHAWVEVYRYDDPVLGWVWRGDVHWNFTPTCTKYWRRVGGECDIYGNYAEDTCTDSSCLDANTCELSAGATFSVSVCPTTTPGPTTTGAPPPTTAAPTTTTEAPPAPECPSGGYCEANCASDYYCDSFDSISCGSVPCSGTAAWAHLVDCVWPPNSDAGVCTIGILTCEAGQWTFTMTHALAHTTCIYQKPATAASCPAGTYSQSGGTCSDCPSEAVVYS